MSWSQPLEFFKGEIPVGISRFFFKFAICEFSGKKYRHTMKKWWIFYPYYVSYVSWSQSVVLSAWRDSWCVIISLTNCYRSFLMLPAPLSEAPVFLSPRWRQPNKTSKSNGLSSYVDVLVLLHLPNGVFQLKLPRSILELLPFVYVSLSDIFSVHTPARTPNKVHVSPRAVSHTFPKENVKKLLANRSWEED